MTPVTVVSGMNNVGKSSLLEAVFLLNDHDAPEVFSMLSGFRGGAYEIGSNIWEPLFYLNRSEDKIIIKTSSLDYKEQELVISADIDYAPVVSNGLKQEIGGQLLAVVKGAYALGFEYTHLNYNEKGLFYYNEMGLKANIETSLPNNARERARWTLLVNSMVSRFQNDLSEWIGKLQIEEKKRRIIRRTQNDVR